MTALEYFYRVYLADTLEEVATETFVLLGIEPSPTSANVVPKRERAEHPQRDLLDRNGDYELYERVQARFAVCRVPDVAQGTPPPLASLLSAPKTGADIHARYLQRTMQA